MKTFKYALNSLPLLFLVSIASAADFTWNGGSPALNNWSTTANWVQVGAPPLSDTTTDLIFSGSTRTAPNAQAAYTINSILFSATGASFNLNGGTITFGGFSPFLRNSSLNNHSINNPTAWTNGGTIDAQLANLTFAGQISVQDGSLAFQANNNCTIQTGAIAGPGSITKSGGGVLQNNGAVLLSGAVSVSAGTLRPANTFSAGPYDSFTGSTLDLNGNTVAFTRLSGSGNIDLNGGTLTINQSTDSSTSSPISGTGNFLKTGTGTLTVNGNLTHIGNTTINGGTLRPTTFLGLSDQSSLSIGANGTLDLSGSSQIIGGLSGSGSIINHNDSLFINQTSGTNVWSGTISGTGQLIKDGDGILSLSSNLAHSGGTTINGGTIAISNSGALGSNASPAIINSGGALQISSNLTLNAAKTITLGGAGPTGGGAIRFEVPGGTGNAFIESSLALADDATITHASSGGFMTLGSSNNPGTLNLGPHDLTLNGSGGGEIRLRHALQGSGTLIHDRPQSLFLHGSNPAFNGPIQVLDGSLKVEAAGALGSVLATAPITLGLGASLDLENNLTLSTDRPLQLGNGGQLVSRAQAAWVGDGDIIVEGLVSESDLETVSASNSLTISGDGLITGHTATLDVNAAADSTITIHRDILLTGLTATQTGLRKIGDGTLILAGQSDYLGSTRVNGGTLQLVASEQLPALSTVILSSGTLDLGGFTQTIGGLVGGGNVRLGSGTLKIQVPDASTKTFSQTISGNGSVEILDSAGLQRFLSSNTYEGPTIIRSGGKLSLESNDALGPAPDVTVETGGLLTVDSVVLRTTALAGTGIIDLISPSSALNIDIPFGGTWGGNLAGPGTLEKNGFSQVTLTNTPSLSGATRVRQGILQAAEGLPFSPVTVDAGASLFARGTIAEAFISGTLRPGLINQSVGSLAVAGPLTFGSGATLNMRIQDWNGSPGTGYDTINCATLNFNAGSTPPVTITVLLNPGLSNFEESPRVFKLIETSSGVIDNFQFSSNVVLSINNGGSVSPEGSWSLRVVGGDLEAVYTPAITLGYESWLSDYNLGALTGPGDDPDGDGIPNLIEFIIGGNPENQNDIDKLPTFIVDATHLEFTFRRSSAAAYLNPSVRYGTDLIEWDAAVDNEDGVTISSESDPLDPATDLVTVRIPRDGAPKLFAQLLASLPEDP